MYFFSVLFLVLLPSVFGQGRTLDKSTDVNNDLSANPKIQFKKQELSPEDKEYLALGRSTVDRYISLRDDPSWKLIETDEVSGIEVQTMNTTTVDGVPRMIFKATAKTPYPPEMFFVSVNAKALEIPTWNPIVDDTQLVKLISPRAKILYQSLQPQAPLQLNPREFLVLTYTTIKRINNKFGYIMTFTDVPNDPALNFTFSPVEGIKRGSAGTNGVQANRAAEDPNVTELTWVASLDFNYPEIKPNLIKLFERFNIILYMDSLMSHVKKTCSKRENNCGVKP